MAGKPRTWPEVPQRLGFRRLSSGGTWHFNHRKTMGKRVISPRNMVISPFKMLIEHD
jgi:hypothetical protein